MIRLTRSRTCKVGGKPAIICYELHAIPWDLSGVGLFEMHALKSPNNKTLPLSLKFEISSVTRYVYSIFL